MLVGGNLSGNNCRIQDFLIICKVAGEVALPNFNKR